MTTAARTYLTGFGDEISPDLGNQLATMKRLGVEALDLRTAYGKNVLQLSDDEVRAVKAEVAASGLRIQTVSSPVNKVKFSGTAQVEELRKVERAAEIARLLGVDRIRIFSPETEPLGSSEPWPDVRSWMADQVDVARAHGLMLLHENDGKFFGAYPENTRKLLEEFHGPNFRAIFDFGNSVLLGCETMRDWFPWLLPFLDTLHIKDARVSENRFVAAGEGDGQMFEAFRFLKEHGWNGPMTLEPHAQIAGSHGGFSGEEAFEHAVEALRKVMEATGY